MIRLIITVLAVLLIAATGWWLASQTGLVVIHAFDREISLSLPVGLAALLLLTLLMFVVWSAIVWLVTLPKKLKKLQTMSRRERGYDALERALIASASGDTKTARQMAEKVKLLMDRPALSGLIAARSAQADGDVIGAERHFETLLEDKRTRIAALRGLTETALQRHDHEGAIVHAKQAFAADPAAKWAFETLFDALIAARNWNEAREILSKGQSKGHLSKLSASRRRAVLLAAESSNLEIDGDMEGARKLAEKAVSAAPGFAPGAALASRLLVAAGKNWRAAGLLEDAWANAPHPALSLAYGDLKEDESVTARAKRMKGLAQINIDHRESKILLAETALSSEENNEARKILEALIAGEDAPSSRLCGLMARVDRADKNTGLANEWLRKSLTAADEADWSDLDPDGPAFGYRAEDWARLVYSFGDAGELIHPRHERFERISRGEEHLLLIENDHLQETVTEDISESLEEKEPIEIPEITAIKTTKPKKRTPKKPSSKKAKDNVETKTKAKTKSNPVMADMPRQPDDPGPGAKADPTTSVLKRKRNAN